MRPLLLKVAKEEIIMAFFDRMKDSLTTAGQEVSQKAKNARFAGEKLSLSRFGLLCPKRAKEMQFFLENPV